MVLFDGSHGTESMGNASPIRHTEADKTTPTITPLKDSTRTRETDRECHSAELTQQNSLSLFVGLNSMAGR